VSFGDFLQTHSPPQFFVQLPVFVFAPGLTRVRRQGLAGVLACLL
jgi:hypothetical protein